MKRKIVIATVLALCFGVITAYAASPNGQFKGFDKVKVLLNGKKISFDEVPAFIVSTDSESKAMMPLRELGEAVGAFIEWNTDNMTANIVRPNTQILLSQLNGFDDDNGRITMKPFSVVRSGSSYSFVIYSEIDSLPKKGYDFKLVIVDPDGDVKYTSKAFDNDVRDNLMSSFIIKEPVKAFAFKLEGTYKIKLLMKRSTGNTGYVTVGEKSITSN